MPDPNTSQPSNKPYYQWVLIPEFRIVGFKSEWVEVKVLARTRCWAMCRRRDTPNAMPFVRSVRNLRDKKPKDDL